MWKLADDDDGTLEPWLARPSALGLGQFIGRRSEPERGAFGAAPDHGRRWKWDAEECGLKKGRRTS